jgi:predicted phage terminase large subunit-like protein
VIPSIIDDKYVEALPEKYRALVERDQPDRFSYWPYKEPVAQLLKMEAGQGTDQEGARMSRHVFSSQYQQAPKAVGGNIIHGSWFRYWTTLPQLKYRKIFVDTAQKTKERNDYSVLQCWGLGIDNNMYLLDQIRGKWEAPELESRTIAFWNKHADKETYEPKEFGQLRQMIVEDKASGTGLIQKIKLLNCIPIHPMERHIDKLTRVMDVVAYIDGRVWLPETAPFTSGLVSECEAFTADDSHDHDDQIDPMVDAINDMLSTGNKLNTWSKII